MRYRVNDKNIARLGLIVSKKTAKLAVQRNYMRRIMRELFRLNQYNLPAMDLVIQIQKFFGRTEFLEIKKEFEYLMQKIRLKAIESKNNVVSTPNHEA